MSYEIRRSLASSSELPRPERDMVALLSVVQDGVTTDGRPRLRLRFGVWEPQMMDEITHVMALAILNLAGYEVKSPDSAVAMTLDMLES